ncbi:MAG: serine/threonine protein kinase, partial [Myxococcales bacterium]|nr:serine/threonine protein kinase [Myxococcales bacterium]
MTWHCPQCEHQQPLAEPGTPCPVHGGTLVHATVLQRWPDDDLLGQVLDDRYAVYDILGRGGMGAVYRGRHLRLGRDVAIKTILPGGRQTPGFDVRERFFLEARMLANLSSPGVVSLHDYGEDAGRLFMVLELVEGVSLQTLLREVGPLAPDRACRLAVGMLRALEAPHALGLVHRDIKPGNIMVGTGPDGYEKVTLIDFGVAKALETDDESLSGPATRTGLTIGTPRYMA